MKKIIPILIILLLIGCKPKQIIQERTVYKVDSTAVTSLKSELQKKTIELQVATTDLERTREQNIKLQSDVSQHEINYDTNAQVDPQTGNYPKASETITESKSLYEKTVKEYETLILEYRREVESLTTENKNLEMTVATLKQENKDLKIKTTPTTGFNFRLFFAGVAAGILLVVVYLFIRIKL